MSSERSGSDAFGYFCMGRHLIVCVCSMLKSTYDIQFMSID